MLKLKLIVAALRAMRELMRNLNSLTTWVTISVSISKVLNCAKKQEKRRVERTSKSLKSKWRTKQQQLSNIRTSRMK